MTFSDYVPKSLQNSNNFSSFFFALYKKSVNLHWKVRKSVSITHKIELSSVIYEKGGQEMSMINHHKRIKIDMLFGFL